MSAISYKDLKLHGINATVTDDGNLQLAGPQAALTPEAILNIRANKSAIIDEIKKSVNVVKVVNINSQQYGYKTKQSSDDFERAIENVCSNQDITSNDVMNELSQDDIDDWHNGETNTETLSLFVRSLIQRREMDQGIVPKDYTYHAYCKGCGPVWLWFSGEVQGCPWCWNRAKGLAVPHP